MSDDSYKKLSKLLNSLTGSITSPKQEKDTLDTESLESSIFGKLIDSLWIEEQIAASSGPGYTLCEPPAGDYHWLFNEKTKSLDRISQDSEVIPIAVYDKDHMICAIGSAEYKIPSTLLNYIGYH